MHCTAKIGATCNQVQSGSIPGRPGEDGMRRISPSATVLGQLAQELKIIRQNNGPASTLRKMSMPSVF